MSAQLRFYSVSKRTNSTAVPTGTPVATLNGTFRQPYNAVTPVVTVQDHYISGVSIFTQATPVNYVQVYIGASDINRYYWIRDMIWIASDLVELHLVEDMLATWSTQIKASRQYVLRSSSAVNGDIIDTWYPIETYNSQQVDNISTSVPWYKFDASLSSGYYIVGIINSDANAYGAVAYYLFPSQAFDALRHELLNSVTWTDMNFTEIEQSLYKSLFNPMQYIASCKWFPMAPQALSGGQGYIDIGWWKQIALGLSVCYKLTNFFDSDHFTLNTNNHPQLARGNYLNTPPYRNRVLFIEPFGAVEINTQLTKNSLDQPDVYWWVDFVTGKAKLRIYNYLGTVVAEAEAMMGVDISIAQSTQNVLGAGMNLLHSAGNVAGAIAGGIAGSAGSVISGVSGTLSGIGSAVQNFMPTVASQGSNGSILAFGSEMLDITYYTYIADGDNADFGSPLCENRLLSGLSGFCMCSHAHVTWAGMTMSERTEIERLLDSGIYLE